MQPDSAFDVPSPVLFNPWKHHAGALKARVEAIAGGGDEALRRAASHVAILGTKLMDVYTGALSPRDVSARVIRRLQDEGRLEREAYRAWILGSDEYAYAAVGPFDGVEVEE